MAAYEPGSVRDPASAVGRADGKVLRGLTGRAAAAWERGRGTAFFTRLTESGKVVRTTPYEGEAPPSPRGEPWARVLEHEPVPVVSYPYEWPFAMLREAAALQLEVLLAALDEGMSLKDGTAYNVQFVGSRPVFIDVGSFEPAAGPWPGYRQFCQTMLFPLLVQAHLGVPYQPLLRGAVDGLSASDVAGMFSGLRRFRRASCAILLHAYLERRSLRLPRRRPTCGRRALGRGRRRPRPVMSTSCGARGGQAGLGRRRRALDLVRLPDDLLYRRRRQGEARPCGPRWSRSGAGSCSTSGPTTASTGAGGRARRPRGGGGRRREVVDLLYWRLRAAGNEGPAAGDEPGRPSGGLGWRNRGGRPSSSGAADATLALARSTT